MELMYTAFLFLVFIALLFFVRLLFQNSGYEKNQVRTNVGILLGCFVVIVALSFFAFYELQNSVDKSTYDEVLAKSESLEKEVADLSDEKEDLESKLSGYSKRLEVLEKAIDGFKTQVNRLNRELADAKDRNFSQYSYTSGSAGYSSYQYSEQPEEEVYVLVTSNGSKYHLRKCGNGTYYQVTLNEALARGLAPCSKCF